MIPNAAKPGGVPCGGELTVRRTIPGAGRCSSGRCPLPTVSESRKQASRGYKPSRSAICRRGASLNKAKSHQSNQILAYLDSTKPDCGPPLPLGVLPPRGGRTGKGGGGGLLPGPLSARGGKKKQKRGGATPSRTFALLLDLEIDEVPGLVFVLRVPVSDAGVSACKHARAPPTLPSSTY